MLRIAKLSSLILGALLLVTVAKADMHEGNKGHVAVHGTLDVFYGMNMTGKQNDGTFTPLGHDDFGIGLAMINFAGSVKHVDYYVELIRGQQAGVTAAGTNQDISQAYLTHHVNDQLSVAVGRMATNVGFEGAFAKDNWNYSRSLAFGNGAPFWHEGLAVKYNHNSGLSAGLFYYDQEDAAAQADKTHAVSLQLGYGMNNWAVVLNHYANKDATKEVVNNVNFTYDLNSKTSFALSYLAAEFDIDGNDQEATSIALYAKHMYSKKGYVALRYEMWSDEEGFQFSSVGTDVDVDSITLTGGFYCDSGSEMRLELRQDSTDDPAFLDEDGARTEDSLMTVSASWIHSF